MTTTGTGAGLSVRDVDRFGRHLSSPLLRATQQSGVHQRNWLLRWLVLLGIGGFITLLGVLFAYPAEDPSGPLRALYAFHDDVWLRLRGNLWTAGFPLNLLIWVPVFGAIALGSVQFLCNQSLARKLHRHAITRLLNFRFARATCRAIVATSRFLRLEPSYLCEVVETLEHEALAEIMTARLEGSLLPPEFVGKAADRVWLRTLVRRAGRPNPVSLAVLRSYWCWMLLEEARGTERSRRADRSLERLAKLLTGILVRAGDLTADDLAILSSENEATNANADVSRSLSLSWPRDGEAFSTKQVLLEAIALLQPRLDWMKSTDHEVRRRSILAAIHLNSVARADGLAELASTLERGPTSAPMTDFEELHGTHLVLALLLTAALPRSASLSDPAIELEEQIIRMDLALDARSVDGNQTALRLLREVAAALASIDWPYLQRIGREPPSTDPIADAEADKAIKLATETAIQTRALSDRRVLSSAIEARAP